jgi:hypothetical protein
MTEGVLAVLSLRGRCSYAGPSQRIVNGQLDGNPHPEGGRGR